MQFRDLGLSLRAINALARVGVQTVEELCELQVFELSHIPGFGMTYVQQVVAGLAEHGLALRPGGAPYRDLHAKKLIHRYNSFLLDSAPGPFPSQADVDAVRTAANLAGATGTPLSDRLQFIARQLAAMLPDQADQALVSFNAPASESSQPADDIRPHDGR
jgi:hypothetical protein